MTRRSEALGHSTQKNTTNSLPVFGGCTAPRPVLETQSAYDPRIAQPPIPRQAMGLEPASNWTSYWANDTTNRPDSHRRPLKKCRMGIESAQAISEGKERGVRECERFHSRIASLEKDVEYIRDTISILWRLISTQERLITLQNNQWGN